MQRSNNLNQFRQSNLDLTPTPSSISGRQVGSYGYDLSERRNPNNNSFLGAAPGSFSNENDLSVIHKNYLSMKLVNDDDKSQSKSSQLNQSQLNQSAYPKLMEKSVAFEKINYIKISRIGEESPFFWNNHANQSTMNQNCCYEVAAKDQFGTILSRKKIFSKQNADLESKINEISFMKEFRTVHIAHVLTSLSQMHNSYKNLKNAYYIQKMDDGEYHGTLSNNNVPNGLGIYYYNDNSVYQGEIEMRSKHHKGMYVMTDGSVYDGGWVSDQMCGEGTLTDPQKNIFRGYFKDGAKEGLGKITYKNGGTIEGNWINGLEEGEFLLTVGENNFKLNFVNGNITAINDVKIDKIPKDFTHYTFIHINVLEDQIVINEQLKPIRSLLPEQPSPLPSPMARQQQQQQYQQQQRQQQQQQQQQQQGNPFIMQAQNYQPMTHDFKNTNVYQYQSPNQQMQQNINVSQNRQFNHIMRIQDQL